MAKEKSNPSGQPESRVWVASKDAVAGFALTKNSAMLVGSEKNFVGASKVGVALVGSSITFLTRGENIMEGGLWKWMPSEVRMIPSTMFTPMPQRFPMPPIPGLMIAIAAELPSFLAFGIAASV